MTDGDYTYHGKHWVMYRNIEPLSCTLEINVTSVLIRLQMWSLLVISQWFNFIRAEYEAKEKSREGWVSDFNLGRLKRCWRLRKWLGWRETFRYKRGNCAFGPHQF